MRRARAAAKAEGSLGSHGEIKLQEEDLVLLKKEQEIGNALIVDPQRIRPRTAPKLKFPEQNGPVGNAGSQDMLVPIVQTPTEELVLLDQQDLSTHKNLPDQHR